VSELTEALASPEEATFRGKVYRIEPLDFNDLADLEAVIGDINDLDLSLITHRLLILWLALRRVDEKLTPQDRENCRYLLTMRQVGKMFPLTADAADETGEFIRKVLVLSGVAPKEEAPAEGEPGNAPAPEVPTEPARPRKAAAAKASGAS
jgi:hypothetical protein